MAAINSIRRLAWWARRGAFSPEEAAPPVERLKLDWREETGGAEQHVIDAVERATAEVLTTIPGTDYSTLERRSPGLRGFDWTSYIDLSKIRVARAMNALEGAERHNLLDFGSYFGNFALAAAYLGHKVTAADSYSTYGAAFAKNIDLLKANGVDVADTDGPDHDLSRSPNAPFSAALCMGVIEHIPHTPKPVFTLINGLLGINGILVIDTPNLCYIYNQKKIANGESNFCPIDIQFDTDVPFEGHHREYTPKELTWMIQRVCHSVEILETFNYSIYGNDYIYGDDALLFKAMSKNTLYKEAIFSKSIKL